MSGLVSTKLRLSDLPELKNSLYSKADPVLAWKKKLKFLLDGHFVPDDERKICLFHATYKSGIYRCLKADNLERSFDEQLEEVKKLALGPDYRSKLRDFEMRICKRRDESFGGFVFRLEEAWIEQGIVDFERHQLYCIDSLARKIPEVAHEYLSRDAKMFSFEYSFSLTKEKVGSLDGDRQYVLWERLWEINKNSNHLDKPKAKKQNQGRDSHWGGRGGRDMSNIVCYNCNERGHYARDCASRLVAPGPGGGVQINAPIPHPGQPVAVRGNNNGGYHHPPSQYTYFSSSGTWDGICRICKKEGVPEWKSRHMYGDCPLLF